MFTIYPINGNPLAKAEADLHRTNEEVDFAKNLVPNEFDSCHYAYSCIYIIPIGIARVFYRVGAIAANILFFPLLVFSTDKCSILKFRLLRLGLDPLHLLAAIICSVMHIAGAILGIFVPQCGAPIWTMSANLNVFMLRNYVWAAKKCFDPDPALPAPNQEAVDHSVNERQAVSSHAELNHQRFTQVRLDELD